jgi:hypothetical protein
MIIKMRKGTTISQLCHFSQLIEIARNAGLLLSGFPVFGQVAHSWSSWVSLLLTKGVIKPNYESGSFPVSASPSKNPGAQWPRLLQPPRMQCWALPPDGKTWARRLPQENHVTRVLSSEDQPPTGIPGSPTSPEGWASMQLLAVLI